MITKARLWLGIVATVALLGCASSGSPTQSDELAELIARAVAISTVALPTPGPTSTPWPTPTPRGILHGYSMGTTIRAADVTQPMDAALLSERIAQADVIIRAEVESVAQVVDSFSIKYHGGYRPAVYSKALEYTLTVHEYLKGSGGYEVVAVVIDHFLNYPTEAEAEAATTDHLSARDTQWEDREGIFFLMDWRSEGSPASTNQTDRYMMGAVRSGMGDYDYYTIASRYSKRWLPAIEADADDGTTPARTYFLDVPTPTGAGPTITLTALKAEITDIAVEVALGNGTNAYRNCVVAKYAQQRRYDHRAASSAAVPQPGFAIGSGLTEGTRVNPENINYKSTTKGWLEGDDNDLFEVDPVGVVKTLRPLPADAYTFQYLERHPDLEPCDAPLSENARAYSTYFVDVAAPNGTDLEAFFDPVTVGTTVAADDTNGQLAPSSFGTTAISSISYESNEVTVTVDPVNGLSGRHLDFISLDGTLALSLEVSDAKKDNTDKTLTWPTTSDPWASGDTLMLRVYGATVDCSGTTTFGSCDQGPNFSASRFTFTVPENTAPGETIGTVLATDPDSSDIVTHSLLSGNEAGHFTIDDSTGVITLANRLDL